MNDGRGISIGCQFWRIFSEARVGRVITSVKGVWGVTRDKGKEQSVFGLLKIIQFLLKCLPFSAPLFTRPLNVAQLRPVPRAGPGPVPTLRQGMASAALRVRGSLGSEVRWVCGWAAAPRRRSGVLGSRPASDPTPRPWTRPTRTGL